MFLLHTRPVYRQLQSPSRLAGSLNIRRFVHFLYMHIQNPAQSRRIQLNIFWSNSHGQPVITKAAMDSQGKTFFWNLYISGVTVMGSHGQSWAALDSHGKNFFWNLHISGVTVMGSHGQSRAAMDSHGKIFLWNLYISGVTVMGSHGQSWAVMGSHGHFSFYFLLSAFKSVWVRSLRRLWLRQPPVAPMGLPWQPVLHWGSPTSQPRWALF